MYVVDLPQCCIDVTEINIGFGFCMTILRGFTDGDKNAAIRKELVAQCENKQKKPVCIKAWIDYICKKYIYLLYI